VSGFIADPGTDFTVGEEPEIAADLNRLAQSLDVTIYGISGYRSPAHSVAVGGFADDPHTKGEAADIGVNSQTRSSAAVLTAAELGKFGLDRPFDESDDPANTEVNHIQLLPKGSTAPLDSSATLGSGSIPTALAATGGAALLGAPGALAAGIGAASGALGSVAQAAGSVASFLNPADWVSALWKDITSSAEYAGLFLVLLLGGVFLILQGLAPGQPRALAGKAAIAAAA